MSTPANPVRVTTDLNGFFTDIFPQPVISLVAPNAQDTGYVIGQVWINTAASHVYYLISVTGVPQVATWIRSSAG